MTASTVDSVWSGLVRTALLGTERTEIAEMGDVAEPLLAELLDNIGDRPPESRLLAAAALVAQYHRVGQLPGTTSEPPPAAAPPETARRCSAAAAAHLRAMLDGDHREALPEWLRHVVGKQLVVPPEDLPRLLDEGWTDDVRPLILAATGERARWLAALKRSWSYATADPDDVSTWDTGSSEARVTLLRELRVRAPERALALLRATWSTEAPLQRAAFLSVVRIGLSMADEPFLEDVLDDRRKEVRSVAANLLVRLPASRLVARMTERVTPLLRLAAAAAPASRAVARTAVEIDLPTACDEGMVRDGIQPKPPRGVGERAWWLSQMIAAVPPSVWSDRAGLTPEQCISAAAKTEWRALLVRAWSTAAGRMADSPWSEALLTAWAHGEPGIEPAPLAAALPHERLEAVIIGLIENATGMVTATESGLVLAAEAEHAWSAVLTTTVMRRLEHLAPPPDFAVRALLSKFALRMYPAGAIAEAERLGEGARGAWLDLLHHRHAMLEALDR